MAKVTIARSHIEDYDRPGLTYYEDIRMPIHQARAKAKALAQSPMTNPSGHIVCVFVKGNSLDCAFNRRGPVSAA